MTARCAALLPALASICAGGVLPIVKLDSPTLEAFDRYVAAYERTSEPEFLELRKFRIDSQSESKRAAFNSGKLTAEVLKGENVGSGRIHHLYGAVHIPGVTAGEVRRTLQNYARYSLYYRPDVSRSSAELLPDSKPADQHFRIALTLQQSTLWLDVAFDTVYDTHYMHLDDHCFHTRSRSTSIREYRDAHNRSLGTYPEGNDHGFLWRMDTWWHARDRDGGVDLEMTNITLTRPVPFGFGWWASHKAKTSIENLLLRTREAVLAAELPRPAAP